MKKNFSALGQIGFILKFAARFLWATDKKSLIIVILANCLFSAVIVPNLILDKIFLDTLVTNIQSPDPLNAFRLILIVVAARFGLQALRTLANRLSGYYARILFWEQNQRAEVMIGTKYATISVPTLEDPQFKDRYQKIERESLNRLQRITENFVRIPQHITGIISSLSIFVFTLPLVVVVSLVSLLPSIIVERIFIKKDYELDTQVSVLHRLRGMYYYFLGRSRSYLELRLLNIHAYLGQKIHGYWQEIIDNRKKLHKSRRTWGFLAGLVDDVVSYSFDAYFAFQIIMGWITIGTGQAYVRAVSSFKQSVSNLTAATLELYENYLYLVDLVWFLDLENPYFNTAGLKVTLPLKKGIRFDNVWFKYPGTDSWVLKGVTFDILPRQNIAIVGKNGAGKTTLVKLLCGFYTPVKGRILVDGVEVGKLNKPDYWAKLSVLFQEFEGYNVTARESIAASHISRVYDTPLIRHYSKMSDIDSWISSLPKGYDNALSRDFEGGITPSTGQWQRIGIARVLFKDPAILILDEPTSNVDPEAEEQIFNQVLRFGKQKMIIFISHRFSTVRRADKIIVLEDGAVSESGAHADLMAKKGIYAKLFTLQAKNYQ